MPEFDSADGASAKTPIDDCFFFFEFYAKDKKAFSAKKRVLCSCQYLFLEFVVFLLLLLKIAVRVCKLFYVMLILGGAKRLGDIS